MTGRAAAVVAGASIAEVPTPALVLDLDAMERNIILMATFARENGVRLRPQQEHPFS